MKIEFQIRNNPFNQVELYFGDKKRFSTLTSVVLLTPNLLVVCSYYSRQIFLISFDINLNSYQILDTKYTYSNKLIVSTDLIDYNGEYIVTSNFMSRSISMYKIINNKIIFIKSISNINLGYHHGVKFYPKDKNIIFFTTSGTKNKKCGIYAINLEDKKPIPFLSITENNMLTKDVCFSEDFMYGIYSENAPKSTDKVFYSSKVVKYEFSLEKMETKVKELILPECHVDCIQYYKNKIYITVEDIKTNGFIYELDENLNLLRKLGNFSFPHGLDIKFNMFAITEYGTSTLTLINENDFINS